MTTPKPASARSNIVGVGLQERRLGATVLNTYRTTLDIDDIVPNDRQPRREPRRTKSYSGRS